MSCPQAEEVEGDRSYASVASLNEPAASCASLGLPAPSYDILQESLAVNFADAPAKDHTAISDAQVNLLLEENTTLQVVEVLI